MKAILGKIDRSPRISDDGASSRNKSSWAKRDRILRGTESGNQLAALLIPKGSFNSLKVDQFNFVFQFHTRFPRLCFAPRTGKTHRTDIDILWLVWQSENMPHSEVFLCGKPHISSPDRRKRARRSYLLRPATRKPSGTRATPGITARRNCKPVSRDCTRSVAQSEFSTVARHTIVSEPR